MTMQFPEFQATASVWRGDTAPLRDQKVKKKKKRDQKVSPTCDDGGSSRPCWDGHLARW